MTDLTKQQTAILKLLTAGLTQKAIAEKLGTKLKTVEGQIGELYDRLGCRSACALTLYAIREKLTPEMDFKSFKSYRLTPREKEVLKLAAEGNNFRSIARLLSMSPRTAEYHLTEIHKKVLAGQKGIQPRILLVHFAVACEIIDLGPSAEVCI